MTNPVQPPAAPDGDEVHISAVADRAAAVDQAEGAVVATFECRPASNEWLAKGDVVRGAQGLTISRLELQAVDPTGNGITASLLRRIQIGDVLHVARAVTARAAQGAEPSASAELPEKPPRSGGRSALSDELLRSVAVSYLAETAPGRPAGAVKRMAKKFDRPEETVRSWVARARKGGWLGPSVKGRAGAEPGPRLRDLAPEEFAQIFSDAYDQPPQNLAELAAGFESMPKERAQAASAAWFTREREIEQNQAINEWESKQQDDAPDED